MSFRGSFDLTQAQLIALGKVADMVPPLTGAERRYELVQTEAGDRPYGTYAVRAEGHRGWWLEPDVDTPEPVQDWADVEGWS